MEWIKLQSTYNNNNINAVPIITYHDLTYNIQDYNKAATTITVPLFDKEMKYLHDNGFKVLLLNQFGFDSANNLFYIKKVPDTTNLSGAATYSIATSK